MYQSLEEGRPPWKRLQHTQVLFITGSARQLQVEVTANSFNKFLCYKLLRCFKEYSFWPRWWLSAMVLAQAPSSRTTCLGCVPLQLWFFVAAILAGTRCLSRCLMLRVQQFQGRTWRPLTGVYIAVWKGRWDTLVPSLYFSLSLCVIVPDKSKLHKLLLSEKIRDSTLYLFLPVSSIPAIFAFAFINVYVLLLI